MKFLYKLFGGNVDDAIEIFKNIPWSKIQSLTSQDQELIDIYKKLFILQNEHKSSLDDKQISLVKLYLKTIIKKLPKDIVDKLSRELSEKTDIRSDKEESKPIVPELKSIDLVISKQCIENIDCKKIFNEIPWKLLPTLKKDDPIIKETLEKLNNLKQNYIELFDQNSQQLINLYIKILSKKIDLPIISIKENQTIDKKIDQQYCKPTYINGNEYYCIGTNIESDNDTLRCVYNSNKIVKKDINNIDLDPYCQNNISYKSRFQQASI